MLHRRLLICISIVGFLLTRMIAVEFSYTSPHSLSVLAGDDHSSNLDRDNTQWTIPVSAPLASHALVLFRLSDALASVTEFDALVQYDRPPPLFSFWALCPSQDIEVCTVLPCKIQL